jgi:hypothetical protein
MIHRAIFVILIFSLTGCINTHKAPATQKATDIPFETTQVSYWWNQPAIASASGANFFELWKAAEHTARDYRFQIDVEDQRTALMATQPLLSKQFFEIWRSDVPELKDLLISSLSMMRRTVHFEFARDDDGVYHVQPKVLVERFSAEERRLSSQTTFSAPETDTERVLEGRPWPAIYWYPVGRDHELERLLAGKIAGQVQAN